MKYPNKPLLHTAGVCALLLSLSAIPGGADAAPSRSSSIALSRDDDILLNVNRETHSVAVFEVERKKTGNEALRKIAEVPVGRDPHCVAIDPRGKEAFVTNAASGTVSVIALRGREENSVVAEIAVGAEPRGCALTPSGDLLYVANHTEGTVSVINTRSRVVVNTVILGGKPSAIAITDQGRRDRDQTVFVTEFFAELIPGGPGEGFDDGKQAIVHAFPVADPNAITRITLSPLADSGFSADRSAFCSKLNPNAHSDLFCPDPGATEANEAILNDPQGTYPNQLKSAIIRNGRLYLPNIGAAPEPPVKFNVNVQALVHVVDTAVLSERPDLHVNLNNQIKTESQPGNPADSLDRLFGNDLVAIDCDKNGDFCLIVSRGGNYALRVNVGPDGSLDIGAPSNVVRFQTGNIPSGIVIDRKAQRAYVNNEVNVSVSVLDLKNNTVIARDIPAGTPPEPGSAAHRALLGKLVFFTALGTPDDGLSGMPVRDIVPLQFRGKASDNAWSGCASCHDDGLADGVTWYFPTGPRQTIPLDAFFGHNSPHDQRISNWSALRGSLNDFTFNSINVQGGTGFAGDPRNPNVFPNHGITEGASEALDFEATWTATIRPLNMPSGDHDAIAAGSEVFAQHCASCHGGAKWTKSQTFHLNNPAIPEPGVFNFFDPGVNNAGPQIVEYTRGDRTIRFMDDVGTFDAEDERELRGAGAAGQTALGAVGFNAPALLSVDYHAPYFHNGAAQTLEEVFILHELTDNSTIADVLTAQQQADLLALLKSIDGRTPLFRSAADDFRDRF